MNEKEKFDIGLILGYGLARIGGKMTGKVIVNNKRIHHYWLLGLTPFLNEPISKGMALGAGIEDLDDFIKDIRNLFKI